MKKNKKQLSYFNIENKISFDNTIIEASLKAKKVIESGAKNVYNATIGSLMDEKNNFFVFKSVFDLYNKKISDQVKASYCPNIDGGIDFSNVTKKWLFKNNIFLIENSLVCASPGGSGSLSSVIKKVLDENTVVLIPDYTWEPIELMCNQSKVKIINFKMFNDNNMFYLDDLLDKIDYLTQKYKKIALYLNDPIHNPTSFSMSNYHWRQIVLKLNSYLNNEFVIINDVAYIEFSLDSNNTYLEEFKNINNNSLIVFCISYSKSLTFYGLRLGATIVYHNDKNVVKNIHDLLVVHARANWSNSNHGAIETVVELDKKNDVYLIEKQNMILTLKKRFDNFKNESKKIGLDFLETSIGFFITIPLNENIINKYVEVLNNKNVFVVPLKNGIRVGICSLNIQQCKQLPNILKTSLMEVKKNER